MSCSFESFLINPDPDHCHLCVEMSGNHQNSLNAALQFVETAANHGANSLKLQVYRPETITLDSDEPDFRISPDNEWAEYGTLYDLYQKAHTPWEWIPDLFDKARKLDLPVFASAFDSTAIELLESLDCPAYKIASPEITDVGLIARAARTGKPVILSTGLAVLEDVDRAVETVRRHQAPVVILKCTTAYPTLHHALNLRAIQLLEERYQCPVGFSDHTVGMEAALAACALGATLIEKHFRLPEDVSSVDSHFSMSLDEIPDFKRSLKRVTEALGEPILEIPPEAVPNLTGRRSLYVCKDIRKGEVISTQNVLSVRPSHGMHPCHLSEILGKKAARAARKGEPMDWSIIEAES